MNSKKHKKSSTSAIRLGFLMIDPIVLLAVVLGILLSKLYKDDITIYSNDINKMINEFKLNGTEQTFQDLNSDRQLTLRINKTTSVGKDYKLNYSIMGLNR